jgi:hypothetical protein
VSHILHHPAQKQSQNLLIIQPSPMNTKLLLLSAAFATCLGFPLTAQVVITQTGYTQDFNSIGSGLPTGWTVRTGASASALGTTASLTTAATSWGDTTGAFKNFASATSLTSTATATDQSNSANRALGIRQSGSVGDPGAAFTFNLSTTGMTLTGLSLDLMMLSVQTRSTTWSIQYGTGASPSSFSTLGTYADPGLFGTTAVSFTQAQLAGMSNQANVWFRVAALDVSTGSGNRDSFAIDNFSLTAVPEPSTYAAIAGVLALGLAFWHRRRKA